MGSENDETIRQHTVMATYRLKSGAEPAFVEVLRRHEPTLRELDLIEPDPVHVYRREDDQGRVTFVEVFTWRPGAVGRAHQHPAVAATWEVMEQHLEPHGDRPAMEFPHFAHFGA
jgi:hypothetical protein